MLTPELTDEDLIGMPESNLRPGQLSRAFLVKAAHQKEQEDALALFANDRQLVQQREQLQHEDDERSLEHREAALLAEIHAREREVAKEAEELDRRTIRLADGRRAYVDGDNYRDEQGRELTGVDRAQAEQGHVAQPHAATWQEQQAITAKRADLERARQTVEAVQAGNGGPDAAKTLTGLEREVQSKTAANLTKQTKAPDYGGTDAVAELGGLSGSFNQAVSGLPAALPVAPATRLAPAVPALRQGV